MILNMLAITDEVASLNLISFLINKLKIQANMREKNKNKSSVLIPESYP